MDQPSSYVEGKLAGELETQHDHPSHPEEQNVMTGLHEGQREVPIQLGGFLWPPEHREREKSRREPRVQDVLLLLDVANRRLLDAF